MLRIITWLSYGALAALLAVGKGACSSPSAYSIMPSVTRNVTNRTPYELVIHLTVDGHPMTIDRPGMCSYIVERYHNWPTSVRSSGMWWDDVQGAVALVLPDEEGIIIEVPPLCSRPQRGEREWQVRATAPLISRATLDHFVPPVIWTRDVRNIDSFELYIPIEPGTHVPRHVRVSSISVGQLGLKSHPMRATPQETMLANTFERNHVGNLTYVAHAAEVRPVPAWEKDPRARNFFAQHEGLLLLPARGSPIPVPSDVTGVYRALEKQFDGARLLPTDATRDEIPMIRKGNDWVLDPEMRGVRIYYEYSEIQRVPGQRYFRTVIKRPDWGTEVPLTYKGFTLYPPMNVRQRELYLQSHEDVKRVTDGRLFDPKASVLIWVGRFEMSR